MLAWNTPDTMQMNQSRKVELRVTLDASRFEGLAGRIVASGPTTSEEADVSRHLTAKLESTAFEISPKEAKPQAVVGSSDAVWRWVIEPKKAGKHALVLSVESRLGPEFGPVISSMSREIVVTAVPSPHPTAWDKTLEFVMKNWEKLLTVVLIPLIGWMVAAIRKRRTSGAEKPLPLISEQS